MPEKKKSPYRSKEERKPRPGLDPLEEEAKSNYQEMSHPDFLDWARSRGLTVRVGFGPKSLMHGAYPVLVDAADRPSGNIVISNEVHRDPPFIQAVRERLRSLDRTRFELFKGIDESMTRVGVLLGEIGTFSRLFKTGLSRFVPAHEALQLRFDGAAKLIDLTDIYGLIGDRDFRGQTMEDKEKDRILEEIGRRYDAYFEALQDIQEQYRRLIEDIEQAKK